jgi:DNA-binding HxlR family transcriptional regulator
LQPVPHTCGLAPAIDVISGKWKALLLWAIAEKPRRFGELKRAIPGITEKVLTQHLRELEADGIVHRVVFNEVPLKVIYSATDLGVSLNRALEPLGAWGDTHRDQINLRRTKFSP